MSSQPIPVFSTLEDQYIFGGPDPPYGAPHSPDEAGGKSPIPGLIKTVTEAIVEVFLLCIVGYFLARKGIVDAKTKKRLNLLNVSLFTPALLFSKVAFSLTPAKLAELYIVPIGFVIVTLTSTVVAWVLGKLFRLKKGQRSFAIACSMFMNSNSLPIALMQSLVTTVHGLKWGHQDTKDQMLGRALSYLVLYSTLGIVLRWSYGVRLLSQADDDEEGSSARSPDSPALDLHEPEEGGEGDGAEDEEEAEEGGEEEGLLTVKTGKGRFGAGAGAGAGGIGVGRNSRLAEYEASDASDTTLIDGTGTGSGNGRREIPSVLIRDFEYAKFQQQQQQQQQQEGGQDGGGEEELGQGPAVISVQDPEGPPSATNSKPPARGAEGGSGAGGGRRDRKGRNGKGVRIFHSFPNSSTYLNRNRTISTNASGTSTPSYAHTDDEDEGDEVEGEGGEREDPEWGPHARGSLGSRLRKSQRTSPTWRKVKNVYLKWIGRPLWRFGKAVGDFMTVPLWAALLSLIVACIPPLQSFLEDLQPVKGALKNAGNCSVPITLVVLGAYFHREPSESSPASKDEDRKKHKASTSVAESGVVTPYSTSAGTSSPRSPGKNNLPIRRNDRSERSFFTDVPIHQAVSEQLQVHKKKQGRILKRAEEGGEAIKRTLMSGETRTVIVALLSRMIIVPAILLPLLGIYAAKTYNIADDPVFIVVACLVIGSPPAITLAQITQAAGDQFERLISKTLFFAYAFLTPPTTIALVLAGLLIDQNQ